MVSTCVETTKSLAKSTFYVLKKHQIRLKYAKYNYEQHIYELLHFLTILRANQYLKYLKLFDIYSTSALSDFFYIVFIS